MVSAGEKEKTDRLPTMHASWLMRPGVAEMEFFPEIRPRSFGTSRDRSIWPGAQESGGVLAIHRDIVVTTRYPGAGGNAIGL
jgi:hypothetical protein